MIGRGVERVETVVLILDLRAIGDLEADLAEAADNVLGDLRQRMKLAQETAAPWQREIGPLLGATRFEVGFGSTVREGRFNFSLGDVDGFTGRRLFLLRQCAKLLH